MFRFYYQPIKIMNQNHLSCHHNHMTPELLNTWHGPVSLFSSFPVHIAALVPQCLGLHLSLFIPCVSVFLSLSVYFCVSFFRLTLVSFPFFLSASPSIYLHVYTTPRLFLYLSVFLSFCPSFYLSVCLSVCLRISLSDEQQGVKIPSLREVLDCVEVRVVE